MPSGPEGYHRLFWWQRVAHHPDALLAGILERHLQHLERFHAERNRQGIPLEAGL